MANSLGDLLSRPSQSAFPFILSYLLLGEVDREFSQTGRNHVSDSNRKGVEPSSFVSPQIRVLNQHQPGTAFVTVLGRLHMVTMLLAPFQLGVDQGLHFKRLYS